MRGLVLRARDVKLELAVRSEQTPVSLVHHLAVVTLAQGLPRLVESLKVEDIHTPGEHAADTLLPVLLGVLSAGLGSTVVRTAIWYQSVNPIHCFKSPLI